MGIEATVFVVDDDVHGRERIHDLIATVGLSVESYGNAYDFLSTYDGSRFGCLLLDVRLPGMSGLDLQKKLIRNELAPPIIMLSKYGDVSTAVSAMKAGAIDFFQKPFNDQVLLDRVHEAIAQDAQQRRDFAFRVKLEAHFALLTPREREVMELVVSGCPNKIIAANLQLSQKTVEAHRAQVMKKTRANSLAELVRMAVANAQPRSTVEDSLGLNPLHATLMQIERAREPTLKRLIPLKPTANRSLSGVVS